LTEIGFGKHNHAHCIAAAIHAAEAFCAREKLQFTKTRRRVLEILLSQHKALGAYEILDQLAAEGQNAQPPVAYRALDFLVSNGFAHKVEKLNAYIACSHPGAEHAPAFMICRGCNAVLEACLDTASRAPKGMFGGAAQAAGFRIETAVIEASGLCPACQSSAA